MSNQEHQANLDHIPFIEQGAEPPAHMWRTRHGPAVVWWSLGRPFNVELALYPDGTRGIAKHVQDSAWRRQAADNRRWVHGTVVIQPNDVVFTDGRQPVYTPPSPTDVPDLEADLARDIEFRNALQDDRFAHAVYAVLSTHIFYKKEDEQGWISGSSGAAALIADLRGLGETYSDWYPHGGIAGVYPDDRPVREAEIRASIEWLSRPLDDRMAPPLTQETLRDFERPLEEMEEQRLKLLEMAKRGLTSLDANADAFTAVHTHLTRIGWRTENAEDRKRNEKARSDRLAAFLPEIETLEMRPSGVAGDGTQSLSQDTTRLVGRDPAVSDSRQRTYTSHSLGADELRSRLSGLATTGRISKPEYYSLLKRLNEIDYGGRVLSHYRPSRTETS
jgi:hypothetical protein